MNPKELIKLKEKEIKKWTYSIIDISGKKSRVEEVYDYKKGLCQAEIKTLKQMDKLWRDRIEKLSITQDEKLPVVIEHNTRFIFTDELLKDLDGTKNEHD